LALVVFEDQIIGKVQKSVDQFTYDAGDIDLRILVLSKNELQRTQNK